jgi:hypothetical protein
VKAALASVHADETMPPSAPESLPDDDDPELLEVLLPDDDDPELLEVVDDDEDDPELPPWPPEPLPLELVAPLPMASTDASPPPTVPPASSVPASAESTATVRSTVQPPTAHARAQRAAPASRRHPNAVMLGISCSG